MDIHRGSLVLNARRRPGWWSWELELSPHVLRRMRQRELGEVDLRLMLTDPDDVEPQHDFERWQVRACDARGRQWELIVEPDPWSRRIVVVTAYRVDS